MAKKPKIPPITAGELEARLARDPVHIEREKQWSDRQAENRRMYFEATGPLLAELAGAGFHVNSLGELTSKKINYKAAIPILMRWFPKITYLPAKQDLLRTFVIKNPPPEIAPFLIEQFYATSDEQTRWAIGNTLAYIADDRIFNEVAKIVKDPEMGPPRMMFTLALGKMRNPHVKELLIQLLDDHRVLQAALEALGKLKVSEVKSHIEPFLNHPDALIRTTARKALQKIDRSHK